MFDLIDDGNCRTEESLSVYYENDVFMIEHSPPPPFSQPNFFGEDVSSFMPPALSISSMFNQKTKSAVAPVPIPMKAIKPTKPKVSHTSTSSESTLLNEDEYCQTQFNDMFNFADLADLKLELRVFDPLSGKPGIQADKKDLLASQIRLKALGVFELQPSASMARIESIDPKFATNNNHIKAKSSHARVIGSPVLLSSSSKIKTIPISILLADLELIKRMQHN